MGDEMTIINKMRERLVPKGTKQVVRLSIKSTAYFDYSFVTKCIDQVEKKTPMVAAGLDTFSPLELLAMEVLADSVAD